MRKKLTLPLVALLLGVTAFVYVAPRLVASASDCVGTGYSVNLIGSLPAPFYGHFFEQDFTTYCPAEGEFAYAVKVSDDGGLNGSLYQATFYLEDFRCEDFYGAYSKNVLVTGGSYEYSTPYLTGIAGCGGSHKPNDAYGDNYVVGDNWNVIWIKLGGTVYGPYGDNLLSKNCNC